MTMIGRTRPGKLTWAEIQDLQLEIEHLRQSLLRYGKHDAGCGVHEGRICDCGFTDACRYMDEP